MFSYIEPLLTLVCVVNAVAWWRLRRCGGSWLLGVATLGLFAITWPPSDWLLARPLEGSYRVRPFEPSGPFQAIVVLAAGVEPPVFERPYAIPDPNTYRRCRYGAWLYSRYGVPVLASGGRGTRRRPPYSHTMREVLQQAGVPAAMIWTEERSGSTRENAVESAEILKAHHVTDVALVVDASSMPRAAASFRKVGIHVQPAPSEFHQFGPWQEDVLPNWKAVGRTELTLHEIVALGWYWLHGWI